MEELTESLKRQCAACGSPITQCFGFVKAGDQLEGRIPPRELCGRCAFTHRWTESGELIEDLNDLDAEIQALSKAI